MGVVVPSGLVELHRALNRETADSWRTFADHRARVTALALEAGGETCAVLGAGNCNDLDLEALAQRHREIHLVDLDREAVTRARERQPPTVAERFRALAGLTTRGEWRRPRARPEQVNERPATFVAINERPHRVLGSQRLVIRIGKLVCFDFQVTTRGETGQAHVR